MDGLLIIDKPKGPTSSDVVQRVRRLLKVDKVGHTGTLDPLATGVLPVCLGQATALAQMLTAADKAYSATLQLGRRTETGDAEGKVVEERPVPALTRAQVEDALSALQGPQLQTPPMFSAAKVQGERLYELARRGQSVEREARPIVLHALALETLEPSVLRFSVRCSKGTYVRVLGEDLAVRLGTVGHLTALRRTQSGPLSLAQAVDLLALDAATPGARAALLAAHLIPMSAALGDMPRVIVDGMAAVGIAHGRRPPGLGGGPLGPLALLDAHGTLLALAERKPGGVLTLSRVFVQPKVR